MSDPRLAQYQSVFRAAPFVADLGAELLEIGDGLCRSRLLIEPRHLQHSGVVHAGVITTLADHSAGGAAQTLVPEGHMALTAELKLSLLRGAKGQVLRCEARVIKPGRQLIFTEADVFCDADGASQLVARLSATMAVVKI
ncbi:PaaI family thioesterase [Paucibacter soli]|uniref:PaaI family thioesterase n=1 Tax=Paucibacter soli TaxID=3133433 RepID=UPI0030A03E1C